MKIVDKSMYTTMQFLDLEIEDVFRWEGRLFMKTSDFVDDSISTINAYDFGKHRLTGFDREELVEYIPTELILHEKGWE